MVPSKQILFYNQLAFKIICGVTIALLAVGAVFSYHIVAFHKEQMMSNLQNSTSKLSKIVVTSLEYAMLEREFDLLMKLVSNLKEEEGVESILILNKQGEIKISHDPQLLSIVIDRQNPTCAICHKFAPENRSRTIVFNTEEGKEVFRSVTPIQNKPKCYACHNPKNKINGVLIMDFSTAETWSLLASNRKSMYLLIGTMMVGMILAISLLLTRLVTRRVRNLERTAQTIEEGDLDRIIEERGNDEIASLAHHFNKMTISLKGYIEDSRRQKEYLENLINSVDDGVMVIDNNYRVILANNSCVSLFGLTLDEIHGNLCYMVSHSRSTPCDDPLCPCPVSQTFRTGKHCMVIHTFYDRSGREMHMEIHSSPLRDKNGNIYQVIEVLRDITERKQLEAQLIHSERLTSLGILASGLSHEINNPLTALSTLIEGLQKRIDEGMSLVKLEEFSGLLELMVKEIKKSKATTEKLLILSHKSEFKHDIVDVNHSLEETISLFEHQAIASNVEIKKRLHSDLPFILGDETQLRQLFLNMALNALQAMNHGGTLTISSENTESHVSVTFEDTGVGMRREDLSKIFEPFFTTKPVKKNTGLGLTICYKIVEQHEGQIKVESIEGEGSTFKITLPKSLDAIKSAD